MDNLFFKRTTEHFRDNGAFLRIVAPEPIRHFLQPYAQKGTLYDRLVRVSGTPGSGKTTIAKVFEYPAIVALLEGKHSDDVEDLAAAVSDCRATDDVVPLVLGCRLPLESYYRDFWELPYDEPVRHKLLKVFLQSKAVLAWLRGLEEANVRLESVRAVLGPGSRDRSSDLGGLDGMSIQSRARAIEAAVYRIISAVLPPDQDALPTDINGYDPFLWIESITLTSSSPADSQGAGDRTLRPLVILDDAHALHTAQFDHVFAWLTSREMKIGRWILARFDIFHKPPDEEKKDSAKADEARTGPVPGRDYIDIRLQEDGDDDSSPQAKKHFQKTAKDMATRYLRQMPIFSNRNLTKLSALLAEEAEPPVKNTLDRLTRELDATQTRLSIKDERRHQLRSVVEDYCRDPRRPIEADVRMQMINIAMHRYSRRVKGPTLFDGIDPDPSRPVMANAEMEESARLQLLHLYDRPFYYGVNCLYLVSSKNAEQFLRLAGGLVEEAATAISRGRFKPMRPSRQDKILRDEARDFVAKQWDFPYSRSVKAIVQAIGERCRETTLEPNGWLRPNAYGMPQAEFEELRSSNQEMAAILLFGMAYNAWKIKENYSCKNQMWCLIELGGIAILSHGLTLRRGGFLEGRSAEFGRFADAK